MKHELRVMLPQGSGSIVKRFLDLRQSRCTRRCSLRCQQARGGRFTKAAALEYAESGVRINVVAPGPTETGMLNRFTGTPENKADLISRVPMKRIAQPEEIAEGILFLAPNKASYITGASLAADGGKLAR
jgi:hypothetical protein